MLGVEAIRTAQKKYGNKPLTGEQIRWGFENLDLTAARIKELGFEGMLKPIKLSCQTIKAPTSPRPAVGRQGVEGHLRLLHGRPVDRSIRWSRSRGQVRRREEDHPARLLQGELSRDDEPSAMIREMAAASRRLDTPQRISLSEAPDKSPLTAIRARSCHRTPTAARRPPSQSSRSNNIEVIYDHVILVLKGVSLAVPEGRHRRAARRQRRRQDRPR